MKPLPVVQPIPDPADLPAPTTETTALVADAATTAALKPAILDAISHRLRPRDSGQHLGARADLRRVRGRSRRRRHPMTLTAPGCPAAQSLPVEVAHKVKAVPGVTDAKVDVVWDPPWTKDRMSDAAKLQLGMW